MFPMCSMEEPPVLHCITCISQEKISELRAKSLAAFYTPSEGPKEDTVQRPKSLGEPIQ